MKTATHPGMAAAADVMRHEIARRRDRLVATQRRGYSTARAALIDQLGQDYRDVYAVQLRAEVAS